MCKIKVESQLVKLLSVRRATAYFENELEYIIICIFSTVFILTHHVNFRYGKIMDINHIHFPISSIVVGH